MVFDGGLKTIFIQICITNPHQKWCGIKALTIFEQQESTLKQGNAFKGIRIQILSKELFKRNDKDLNNLENPLNFRIHNEFEILNTFRVECIS